MKRDELIDGEWYLVKVKNTYLTLQDDKPTKDGDLFVFPNGTIIQVKTDKSINPVMYGITNCFDGLGEK